MDHFSSMTELMSALPARDNYTIQVDGSHASRVKVFAPHGGCIEPCTGPIALSLAMDNFDYFVFSGIRKKDCFEILHVTSTHYNEPRCLAMVREAEVAIALHGCDGDDAFAQVGGGNEELAQKLIDYLNGLGYSADAASRDLKGKDKRNFINLARKRGIQLELSAGFRRNLLPSFPRSIQRHPEEFPKFIDAMRGWMLGIERWLASELPRQPRS